MTLIGPSWPPSGFETFTMLCLTCYGDVSFILVFVHWNQHLHTFPSFSPSQDKLFLTMFCRLASWSTSTAEIVVVTENSKRSSFHPVNKELEHRDCKGVACLVPVPCFYISMGMCSHSRFEGWWLVVRHWLEHTGAAMNHQQTASADRFLDQDQRYQRWIIATWHVSRSPGEFAHPRKHR